MAETKKTYLKCPVCGKNYPTVGKPRGANGLWQAFCGYPCYFATLPKPSQEEALDEWNRIAGMWADTEANRQTIADHLRESLGMITDIRAHVARAGNFARSAGNLESYGRLRKLYQDLRLFEAHLKQEIDIIK